MKLSDISNTLVVVFMLNLYKANNVKRKSDCKQSIIYLGGI